MHYQDHGNQHTIVWDSEGGRTHFKHDYDKIANENAYNFIYDATPIWN